MSGNSKAKSSTGFSCLVVQVADAALAERVAAEAFEAGALGLEEREEEGGITLRLYTHSERAADLRRALASACGAAVRFGTAEPVASVDWSQAWKDGLEPVVVSEDRSDKRLRRRLRVPAELEYLAGHFESFPIVPGVVQLRWALEAARDLLGREPAVRTIEALKFRNVLLPEQSFDLEVTLRGQDRLRFRLVDGDVVFASGRCHLGDAS